MVPVGLAGEATTSPASGAAACACSSISTDGWKRSAGPQASSTTWTSQRGQDIPACRIARPGHYHPITLIESAS